MKLRFFRFLWERAVHHGWPRPLMVWVERRFLDAGLREALRRSAAEYRDAVEAQRRSFAYGQVAMHNPTITREMVDAVADAIPAPESWACLAGDVPDHDAGEIDERDLHGDVLYPSSRSNRREWIA